MLDIATKAPSKPGTTTAEDTLKAKTRDSNVISRGHLVAKALKNEASTPSSRCAAATSSTSTTGASTKAFATSTCVTQQVAAHAADGYARQQATGNAMMAAQKAT